MDRVKEPAKNSKTRKSTYSDFNIGSKVHAAGRHKAKDLKKKCRIDIQHLCT